MSDTIYIFLDESGDLGFTKSGSRFFVLTSVIMARPFLLYQALDELRYGCLEQGMEFEHFHCQDNTRVVRDKVFDLLASNMIGKPIDSLVVEKPKTGPALQAEERFYPEMLAYLLKYVMNRPEVKAAGEVILITDTPPIRKRRQAIVKAIKATLTKTLRRGSHYRILHQSSKAHYGIQVADYCSWAVFKKYESGNTVAYNKIRSAFWSEFDIFRTGTRHYY
ncbi:MAG: DUF3800 domain-containing protein [Chloroflexota bacterium]|nr:DUF3800 domain-containing protein [Chloroflexota bacterium]MDE2969700.1 DUF3800 domain-containing protein [Chloroflexota bacterium]